MNSSINQPIPELARYHARWKKNRYFIRGRDYVVKAGETYLPKPLYMTSDQEYQNYLKKVQFFPAANKVMESWLGLVFKEKPNLIGPAGISALENIITREGDSLEVFAKKLTRETFTTNFTGLLEDHPARPEGVVLNAENAVELGYRPFLAMFPAESILELKFGIVNGKQGFTYVRLLENNRKVVELQLIGGVYTVTMWNAGDNGQWVKAAPITPIRDKRPLNEIPFQIVSTRHSKLPEPSAFEHMVDLNCEIWVRSGDLEQAVATTINPIIAMTNVQNEKDEDGNEVETRYNPAPGAVLQTTSESTITIHSFDGKNVDSIQKLISSKMSEFSRTGSRILADEKAAPEAAETIALRQESDNATLAGLVHSIAGFLENALKVMSQWVGDADFETLKFTMNQDYTPDQLDSAKVQDAITLHQGGYITDEEMFHYLRKPGGYIDPVVSYEEHQSRLDAQVIDRPVQTGGAGTE